MNSNSSNSGQKRELEDVIEEDPQAKHGDQGEAAHGGDQAGPESRSLRKRAIRAPPTEAPIEERNDAQQQRQG